MTRKTKNTDIAAPRQMPADQLERIKFWIDETFRDHDSGMIVGRESWALACLDLIAHIYYLEDVVLEEKQKSLPARERLFSSDHPDYPTQDLLEWRKQSGVTDPS